MKRLVLLIICFSLSFSTAAAKITEENIIETQKPVSIMPLKDMIIITDAVNRFDKQRAIYLRKMSQILGTEAFDNLSGHMQVEYYEIMDKLGVISSIRKVKRTALPSYLDKTSEQMKDFLDMLD